MKKPAKKVVVATISIIISAAAVVAIAFAAIGKLFKKKSEQ